MSSGWFCSTGSCESKAVVQMSRVRVGLHPLGSKGQSDILEACIPTCHHPVQTKGISGGRTYGGLNLSLVRSVARDLSAM